jgi:hypothetical protein
MRDRARIDPELVRAAQPGEAWVIQAGHAVHLRVLPPPAVVPEPAASAVPLPLGQHDTEPLTVVPAPGSGRIAAAVAPDYPRRLPDRPAGRQAPATASTAAGKGAGLAAAGLAARTSAGTTMTAVRQLAALTAPGPRPQRGANGTTSVAGRIGLHAPLPAGNPAPNRPGRSIGQASHSRIGLRQASSQFVHRFFAAGCRLRRRSIDSANNLLPNSSFGLTSAGLCGGASHLPLR